MRLRCQRKLINVGRTLVKIRVTLKDRPFRRKCPIMEQPHSRPRGEGNSREVWREVWVEVCCRGLRPRPCLRQKLLISLPCLRQETLLSETKEARLISTVAHRGHATHIFISRDKNTVYRAITYRAINGKLSRDKWKISRDKWKILRDKWKISRDKWKIIAR